MIAGKWIFRNELSAIGRGTLDRFQRRGDTDKTYPTDGILYDRESAFFITVEKRTVTKVKVDFLI